ncbi:MAG: hypothetical protein IJV99_02920 [Clostridia bacterium]|nr:hypothetical protein [Clostridia bacterium]
MNRYSYEQIKKTMENPLAKDFLKQCEDSYAELYKDKPVQALTYEKFKDYYRTGNRTKFQWEYFERRKRLMLLQVLAVWKDEYLVDLEQTIFEITNEFTWTLPAHNRIDEDQFDYTVIDLFGAETAFYLAETVYILNEKLSNDIKDRVKLSLKTKILDNYESRTFFFDRTNNNWASVCGCSIGLTYLYLFPDRFPLVKDRIMQSMERYMKGLSDNGYCSEGYGYWAYGFGFFCIFFDAYYELTGERPEIVDREKSKLVLGYGKRALISETRYLPFADGGTVGEHEPSMNICAIELLYGKRINAKGRQIPTPCTKALGLRALYSLTTDLQEYDVQTQDFTYMEKEEIFVSKRKNYVFVAKGGCNADMHNHNDVGVMHVLKDNEIVIADIGVGEYVKSYFGRPTEDENGRYSKKIFVCSSLSHSVPLVNGDTQKWGKEHRATVLEVNENLFKLDITKAYVQEIDKLTVEYRLDKTGVDIEYECDGANSVSFRFVAIVEPEKIENGVSILGCKLFSLSGITPTIEKIGYNNHQSELVYAYAIDFTVSGENKVNRAFRLEMGE